MVYPGFGVNYKSAQANWAADMAFFNSIGLNDIRPNLIPFTIPWQIGDPSVPGSFAYWRLCAQTFANAGFYVSWGPASLPGSVVLTSSSWVTYHDAFISEVTFLQSQGIALGQIELGNELEPKTQTSVTSLMQSSGLAQATTSAAHGLNTGDTANIVGAVPSGYNGAFTVTVIDANNFTYIVSSGLAATATGSIVYYNLTISALHTLMKQLATDGKAVYNLGLFAASCFNYTNSTGSTYTEWITNGLGSIDILSLHPYGNINVATQTVGTGGYPDLQAVINQFGSTVCNVNEFGLDSGSAAIFGLSPVPSVSYMSQFYQQYIIGGGFTRSMLYMWDETLSATAIGPNTDYGFTQKRPPNNSMNPMWFTFFTNNPTEYSRGNRILTARTAVARTTVSRATVTRPLFNTS